MVSAHGDEADHEFQARLDYIKETLSLIDRETDKSQKNIRMQLTLNMLF